MTRRAFTLLELAIVLLVSTLMLNFVLGTIQASNPVATAECVNDTRFKLNYIRAQIEVFARKNDRLPLPAARNLGVDAVTYGREQATGSAYLDEPAPARRRSVSAPCRGRRWAFPASTRAIAGATNSPTWSPPI